MFPRKDYAYMQVGVQAIASHSEAIPSSLIVEVERRPNQIRIHPFVSANGRGRMIALLEGKIEGMRAVYEEQATAQREPSSVKETQTKAN